MTDPFWRDQAACTQIDPTLWDTDKTTSNTEAIRICQTCPVRTQCEREAKRLNIEWGIWGGKDFRFKKNRGTKPLTPGMEKTAKAREIAAAKALAEFLEDVKIAIQTGQTMREFAEIRGVQHPTIVARLRRAGHENLIDQWRKADRSTAHTDAQRILDRLNHDPDAVTTYRRYALEMNT